MTAAERVEAAFNHMAPDRTPVFEYVLLSPVADELLGRIYFDYRGQCERWDKAVREMGFHKALRQNVVDRLDLAEKLGHDLLYVCPNPTPPALGAFPASPAALPAAETAPDDPVKKIAARNKERQLALVQEDSEAGNAPGDNFIVFDLLNAEMERRGLNIPLIVPDYVHGLWTDIDLMQAMALDPDTAHKHFAICTEIAMRTARKYASAGIKLIGIGGDFAGKHPMISAEMYRTFIMPELRKLGREIHRLGGRCINTSDGDLWYVIDDFLLGTEADAYMEIDQGAGMDLKRLKAGYGNTIAFLGNIDCGNLLSFGSEAEIRRATIECIESGLGNGGHIFTASNAITESVPLPNYMAMVNAYREFWKLGKL